MTAADDGATGKYVLAPGVREEFGAEAIGGMADLVRFFNAPWPPEGGEPTTATPPNGATLETATTDDDAVVRTLVVVGTGLALGALLALRLRRRQPGADGG